jgi:hypothetical protein
VDGVSVSGALGRIDFELAAAVGTEVVHVGGISPHGVDRGVAVVGTLHRQHLISSEYQIASKISSKTHHSRAGADWGVEVVTEVSGHVGTADVGSA